MTILFNRKNKAVLRIGSSIIAVGLLSLPLSKAYSQTDPQTVLKLQQLQYEIAELRDMVERQNFEIQKLKRSAGSTSGSVSSIPSTGNASPPSAVPISVTQSAPTPAEGSFAGAEGSFPRADGSLPRADSSFPRADGSLPMADSSLPAEGSIPSPRPAIASQPAPVATDAGVVDQRVITAPPLPNNGGLANASQQTPVEERVLGGPISANQVPTPSTNTATTATAIPVPNTSTPGVSQAPGLPQPVFDSRNQLPRNSVPNQNPAGSTVNQVIASPNTIPRAAPPTPVTNAVPESQMYDQGFSLLKEGKYDQANTVFERQLSIYPKGDLADDANYWIAESHYVNRDLDNSKAQFKTIIKNHPQSPRVPDAMLKTAYIEQEQGNVIEARILLQEIVQYHPRSNAAISAKNRLAELN